MLYHHVPGGKADLFVEVMERIFARHRTGLTTTIAAQTNDLRAQLYAVGDWLLAQPPIDMVRLEYVDMPELSAAQVQRLTDAAYIALQAPLVQALGAAVTRQEIMHDDLDLISGGLVGTIQSLHAVSEHVAGKPRQVMAHRLIDVFLDGLRARGAQRAVGSLYRYGCGVVILGLRLRTML
ncbi:TetR/AcrR family transcriptional regulator [Candidatus Gracilibacteria bacterium]|nr:TetR/AcrR family transcriptional regulator [Candidatus Gracilibacteria bacterium]